MFAYDLRLALDSLKRHPGLSALMVLAIALGIAVCTVTFTIYHRSILGAVDISSVVHVTPKRAGARPATLTLPEERWAEQQAGGTWSQLFDRQALTNRYPLTGAVLWYVSLLFLGVLAYPFVRLALPGLADGGYPLARVVGLLLLAYIVWLGGSFRLPCSRLTISLALLLILLFSALLAYRQA